MCFAAFGEHSKTNVVDIVVVHRVNAINEEYQRYMERIRSQAQGAIDKANQQYEHSMGVLTASIDTYLHFLQQRQLVPIPVGSSSLATHMNFNWSSNIVVQQYTGSMRPPCSHTASRRMANQLLRLLRRAWKQVQRESMATPQQLLPMARPMAKRLNWHSRRCFSGTPTSLPVCR